MIKVGEHITIDFLGVKKDYTPEFYEKVIYKIAKAAKVEILNVASHKFEPQGFTLVALLSESHFSFHTFPEKGVISFDFFTCGKVNPKVALKILRKEIDHKRVVTNAFERSSVGLYDDIYKKVLVSNGRSLIINSKKIKNYYIYKLKDTPLDLILDKKYLIKKIESINKIEENNDTFFFEIEHNKNLVTIFFDKKRFDIQGWSTVDIYQNKVETKLFEVETNLMIDDNIYRIQKYIN